MSLKGYAVTDFWADVGSMLVFAEGYGEAKSLALHSELFCESEYIYLRCKRQPEIDQYADDFGRGFIEGSDDREIKLMRDLGWYQVEGSGSVCRECELYEWEDYAPSLLTFDTDDELEEEGVCAQCLAAKP